MSQSRAGAAVAPPRRRPGAEPPRRTLWEEGRRPGRQVTAWAVLVSLAAAALNLVFTGRLSLFYDLVFVTLCLAAALTVRRQDFFRVGVLPPLLLLGTVLALALVSPRLVADADDPLVQAVVSGLAHHAGGLVAGYALTLGVLALRQVALRNAGRLRS